MAAGKLRVVVMQDGARLHYAMPRAIRRADMLAALYTDWYNDKSRLARMFIVLARRVRPLRAVRMEQRRSDDLDGVPIFDAKLLSIPILSLWSRWEIIQTIRRGAIRLRHRRLFHRGPIAERARGVDVVLAFTYFVSLRYCRVMQSRGIKVVADQPIAAARELTRQRGLADHRWPGWEPKQTGAWLAQEIRREAALLPVLDHLLCASQYVKDSLVAQGIAADKISVVPYPTDTVNFAPLDRRERTGPVVVGFVGSVNLRKGAPWFLEVARRCDPKLVKFVMVGPIELTGYGQEQLRRHVELIGSVPRSEVSQWLERFDIFLFPSTCEGSAGVVMEAMATALPVITTPNSGTVARHGVDGFIAAYDQSDLLAQRVMELARDSRMRLAMGHSARKRAEEFDIDRYSRELAGLLSRIAGTQNTARAAAPQAG